MNEKEPKKFYIHLQVLVTRMFLIIVMMAVVPVLVIVSRDRSMNAILPVLIIFEGLVLVFVFWLMHSYIYVELSPQGIRYRSLGYQIESSWENIAGVEQRSMTSEGVVEGLALRGEGTHVNPILKAGTFISLDSRIALREARDFIPLSMLFTKEWRETEVGEAIRQYAPSVLERKN